MRPYQLSLAESSVLPHQSNSGNAEDGSQCLDTKKNPAEAGPSVRVFAEEGVLVFRNWAIPSTGIGSFGENARHRSVAAEQQIRRHRPPTCDHLQRSATNHTSFSSRYSACACTHHCAAPVLGGHARGASIHRSAHHAPAYAYASAPGEDRLQSDPHPQTGRGVVHGRSKGPKLDPSPKLDRHLREHWLRF